MPQKKLEARHGIVCNMPDNPFGYFGWPSVARLDDGTLVVGASGLRMAHICPWGKTVLFTSRDEGQTWSPPRILNDTPLDDRDGGVVSLGGSRLLVTWFTSDTRRHREQWGEEEVKQWDTVFAGWSDEVVAKWLGSWIRISEDGEAWGDFIRVPVTTPHGPIVLQNGDLLYLGKGAGMGLPTPIHAAKSTDGGKTWAVIGTVPNCDGTDNTNFHEPHLAELPSGKLIGMIRYQHNSYPNENFIDFSLFQTESEDGGKIWTRSKSTGVYGSPPHLIRHSSGALVCVYGYRKSPFGIRAMLSHNEGATWEADLILRDDGKDDDLGYPCSVELSDGRIFTVYYMNISSPSGKCGLGWSCWRLPV